MNFKSQNANDRQNCCSVLFITSLRRIARQTAICAYLNIDQQEDFCSEFTIKMLPHLQDKHWRDLDGPRCRHWLRKCAHNALRNYLRHDRYIRSHELEWPQCQEDDGEQFVFESIAAVSDMDKTIIRQELLGHIEEAINKMEPDIRLLFRMHYVEGYTIAALAKKGKSNYDAIRKRLKRACKRVKAYLEQRGINAAEAVNYLLPLE